MKDRFASKLEKKAVKALGSLPAIEPRSRRSSCATTGAPRGAICSDSKSGASLGAKHPIGIVSPGRKPGALALSRNMDSTSITRQPGMRSAARPASQTSMWKRPVCANSGHSPTEWGPYQIDPKPHLTAAAPWTLIPVRQGQDRDLSGREKGALRSLGGHRPPMPPPSSSSRRH